MAAATAAATTAGVITVLNIMRPNTGAPNMTTADATIMRTAVGSSARIRVPGAAAEGNAASRRTARKGEGGWEKRGAGAPRALCPSMLYLVLMVP